VLFVGRAVEGVATGILMPLVQVVVFTRFPSQRWGTIMGFVGLTFGVAPNLGPTIGGAVTAVWSWRVFFLGALALSLVAMAAMAKLLASGRAGDGAVTMDAPSLLLSILGFGGLLLGVSNAASAGFASAACLAPTAVGAVFVVAFVRREKRVQNPMLNMSVFSDRDFSLGTVMVSLLFCAFIGVALVLPLELQSLHGFDAMQAGMALLPGTVAAFIMAPVGGMLTDRVGARVVCAMGSVLLTVGTVLMLHLSTIDSLGQVMVLQAVRAFGISSLVVPYTTWSVHGLPHEIVADGTSISNAARQIAAAIGTSSMVLLMAGGATDGSVTAAGVDAAMLFSLVLTVAMTVLTFVFVKK
jgi:EmrB/QacA subfamily drug resistance transporter